MDYCPGCADNGPTNVDHYHQYIGGYRQAVGVFHIDGHTFRTAGQAWSYVKGVLECTNDEAMKYIRSLPKVYN